MDSGGQMALDELPDEPDADSAESYQGTTVLVIDDDSSVHEMMDWMLTERGFEPLYAESREEGVDPRAIFRPTASGSRTAPGRSRPFSMIDRVPARRLGSPARSRQPVVTTSASIAWSAPGAPTWRPSAIGTFLPLSDEGPGWIVTGSRPRSRSSAAFRSSRHNRVICPVRASPRWYRPARPCRPVWRHTRRIRPRAPSRGRP